MAVSDSFNTPPGAQPALDVHHILQNDLPSFSPVQQSDSSTTGSLAMRKGKRRTEIQDSNRPNTHSSSSRHTHRSASTRAESRAVQPEVRTLPPWIDSFEDPDEAPATPTDQLLSAPHRTHSAQHHHSPTPTTRRISHDGFVDSYDDGSNGSAHKGSDKHGFFGLGGRREPVRGRKWDHKRVGDPVITRSGLPQTASPWRTYIKASMYGPAPYEEGQRVNEDFLSQQTPGYERPWRGDIEGGHDPEKSSARFRRRRKTFTARAQHTILMHPMVPLVFRVTVLTTSAIALGISGSIYHLSNKYHYDQNPSTVMAVVVDVVAIPYILYITWDEYTGKPLGLRSPSAKIRLVLLDLFFIIFESANISLAFAALTDDNGSCQIGVNGYNYVVCHRVKALCAILMIALVAWSMTFAVSIWRLVERVGGRESD